MSTTSRPRRKPQPVTERCQVEIVELAGTYVRNAGAGRLQSSMGPNFVGLKTLPRAIFVARGLRQHFSKARHFTCCLVCISGR